MPGVSSTASVPAKPRSKRGRPPRAHAADLTPEFADLFSRFLIFCRVECGLAANSIHAYRRDLLALFTDPAIARKASISKITPRDLSEHLARLRKDHNHVATTVNRHLATLRVFFKWATSTGLLTDNPTDLLDRPRPWRKLPAVLTPAQIKQLLSTRITESKPTPSEPDSYAQALALRDAALLELIYASGLRASEAASIVLKDLSLKAAILRVTGKGDKTRLVPIGAPARKAVQDYLDRARPLLIQGLPASAHQDRLLLSRTGRPLERVAVWQIVKRAAKSASMGKVHPHVLRHSFATHLLIGGANLKVVQQLLGHADVATTQIYTHVDTRRLREMHNKYHPRK